MPQQQYYSFAFYDNNIERFKRLHLKPLCDLFELLNISEFAIVEEIENKRIIVKFKSTKETMEKLKTLIEKYFYTNKLLKYLNGRR